MPPAIAAVLRRGAVFLWHQYDRLDDPNLAGQTKAKFIVILSRSPLDDPLLYVLTTSEKPRHEVHPYPADLVRIPAGEYPFFPLATVLDASEAGELELERDELVALYNSDAVRHVGSLRDEHVAALMERIAACWRVSRRVKQVLA